MTSPTPPGRRRGVLAAVVATSALIGTVSVQATAYAEPGEPVVHRFDLQPPGAPVAEGFTEVTRTAAYTAEAGYGFTELNLGDRDRGGALDALRRDFVLPPVGSGSTFVVDVPDGEYHVTTWSGDGIASSRTAYTIEGVAYGDQGASSGTVNERVFDPVVVEDGQMTIHVAGSSPRLNGIQILSALAAPTGLAASVDTAAPSVTLTWDAVPDVDGYRLYRTAAGGEAEVVTEQPGTTYTDAGVQLAGEYSYQVAAVAQGREGTLSDPVDVSVVDPDVAPPATPAGLTLADIGKEHIALTWTGDDAATAYDVQRSRSPEGPFATLARVSETSYTDEDVLTTVEYSYRVVAVNAGGASQPSAVLTTEAVTTLVRQAEHLDRAPVAVRSDDGVHVGWRHLGTDPDGIAFHVYRDGVRITDEPVTGATNLLDEGGDAGSTYRVTVVTDDTEADATEDFGVWAEGHLDIPLDKPADGVVNGQPYSYRANDVSVGDLDGDGTYEVVLKWDPTNSQDNSRSGYTGNVLVDAYELDGTRLWRVDLGRNIRAGAHYTQPMVYDLDGDGRAEVVMKTADGTTDGAGTVIGDAEADHRNSGGYVLAGPEYLTLFDGETGAALDTVDYVPPRGNVGAWGDGYGNRVDRFLAGVAYLDGERPSVVFSRGYYTRTVVAAWDVVDDALVERWVFDSDEAGEQYEGQGNHQFSVADADGDGKDEIVFGAMTIDDDGTVLNSSGLGHGDAMHVSDLVPDREGLEVFQVFECMSCSGNRAAAMRDLATGEVIWEIPGNRDTGRGAAADIDPRFDGAEAWAIGGDYAWNSQVGHLMAADGTRIGEQIPAANFVTWWDGDLLREITDHDFDATNREGVPTVSKWDYEAGEQVELMTLTDLRTNNDTKGNPALQADLFGDWREELVYRTADSTALRVLTTTDVTGHRLRTLMHDPVYRLGVAGQNVAYNQPPHTSYFLGEGMERPPAPSITTVGGPDVAGPPSAPGNVRLNDDNARGTGVHDGDYTVTATMNAGQNATVFRLYENGVVIHSELLTDDTPEPQVVEVAITGRANGDYRYVAELVNATGTTTSPERKVKVKDAG
jgi:fibronectin type 3 domain-containing protein